MPACPESLATSRAFESLCKRHWQLWPGLWEACEDAVFRHAMRLLRSAISVSATSAVSSAAGSNFSVLLSAYETTSRRKAHFNYNLPFQPLLRQRPPPPHGAAAKNAARRS